MHITSSQGAIMSINFLMRTSQQPPRADKSAPTDDRISLLMFIIGPLHSSYGPVEPPVLVGAGAPAGSRDVGGRFIGSSNLL